MDSGTWRPQSCSPRGRQGQEPRPAGAGRALCVECSVWNAGRVEGGRGGSSGSSEASVGDWHPEEVAKLRELTDIPLLVLHGAADTIVPAEQAKLADAAARSGGKVDGLSVLDAPEPQSGQLPQPRPLRQGTSRQEDVPGCRRRRPVPIGRPTSVKKRSSSS